MPEFPSVEWFEAVRESANGDSQFTSQGTVNCVMGVKAGDDAFAITFEGFRCAAVESISEGSLRDLDFYIDLSTRRTGASCWTTSTPTAAPTQPTP